MTSLKELQTEAERLWMLELVARRKAVVAERVWRAALKEYYGDKQLESVGCDT